MSKKRELEETVATEFFGWNSGYVADLYAQYCEDPDSVTESWQEYFEKLQAKINGDEQTQKEARQQDKERSQDGAGDKPATIEPQLEADDEVIPLRGPKAKIVENMELSLSVPTATSQRIIPVKVLEENRRLINRYIGARQGGKISFTHLIAWAIIKALADYPVINSCLAIRDGVPNRILRKAVNFGLAVDLERKDGSRSLVVPNVKHAEEMNFREFVEAYEDVITRTRKGVIEPSDFQGSSITLSNPGTVGTVTSLPRLMLGQGAIIAIGAIQYPPEYHAMALEAVASLGLSKVMGITCTYDHRIIQGAESGMFLARVHELLVGKDEFYQHIYGDLHIPHRPFVWSADTNPAFFSRDATREEVIKQARVLQLINMYRVRGHLIANLDPLNEVAQYHEELDPANYGFTIWDLDREFITGGLGGTQSATLRTILDTLNKAYAEKIGAEYMHIQRPEEKTWLQKQLETDGAQEPLEDEARRRILRELTVAQGFERFLHTRFIGHKRFSLEGAEVVVPLLGCILTQAIKTKTEEAVIGMAHRGRLNILATIIGKPYERILAEFEGNIDPESVQGTGDVKYHLGAAGEYKTHNGDTIPVALVPNPSHLEAVNPVVQGIVRAKQDRLDDTCHECVLPITLHGDAAFAGQGIVAETLNLSQLHGYRTGGTVHIIINNQIGFTTGPQDARSSPYATDIAKMVQAPILHVNADDPEAVVRVAKIAFEYRKTFQKDVVIDVVCYRRHGHNEGDEPSYTQPLMYKKIDEHPSVQEIYKDILIRKGVVSAEEVDKFEKQIRSEMDDAYKIAQKEDLKFEPDVPLAIPQEVIDKAQPRAGGTAVDMSLLRQVVDALTDFPGGFKVHPKLAPQFKKRKKMLYEENKIDWAFAESLAFGTLLCEGTSVRLSGQDSTRGTFSQRHLALVDLSTGEEYLPLNNIMPDQARLLVYDSLLSEEAVLGFEFGYSVADPLTLVMWEAQFGDFANGAQVIIDNFIVASEAKWQQPCDLVLLLPHGFEGQGPEHSSARLERFLILCAENNMRVCNCSTPAQYFHILRRQMRDAKRKPLVLMTPKSLLRHPRVVSTAEELTDGQFMEVVDDTTIEDKKKVTRVLMCSGKIYYELLEHREKESHDNVAIVRLEQFYPFPEEELQEVLASYANAKDFIWVQEEPKNMGAWLFLRCRVNMPLPDGKELKYVGRREYSSPAHGSLKKHTERQKRLVREAFE